MIALKALSSSDYEVLWAARTLPTPTWQHIASTGFIALREGGAIMVLLCPVSAVRGNLSTAVSCGK